MYHSSTNLNPQLVRGKKRIFVNVCIIGLFRVWSWIITLWLVGCDGCDGYLWLGTPEDDELGPTLNPV
jgi:hypothetical protein